MNDLTVKQAAALTNQSAISVRRKCNDKDHPVPGAYQPHPRMWLIPHTGEALDALKKIKPGRK